VVPIVLVGMNVVYALSAYPAGVLSDRFNRKALLAAGTGHAGRCRSGAGPDAEPRRCGDRRRAVGAAHGIYPRPCFAALVADAAPPELRGTAFGYFNLLTGLAMLAASVIAGALWDAYGPAGTFFAGLAFALVALLGLLTMRGEISNAAAE